MAVFHVATVLDLSVMLRSSWCQDNGGVCLFGISSTLSEYLIQMVFPVIWHTADSLASNNFQNQYLMNVLSYRTFGVLFSVFLALSYVSEIFTTADHYGRWQTPAAIDYPTGAALLAVSAVCVVKLLSALLIVGQLVRRTRRSR